MEEHKARALQRFLGGSIGINECCKALESKVDELTSSYQSLGDEWKGSPPAMKKFLMLMVKDGVFLYEFMRGYPDGVGLGNGVGWDYDKDDPVFSVRALRNIPNIVADILMLENQLPITVLERLIAVEKKQLNELHHKEVNELVLKFLLPELPSLEEVNELVLKLLLPEQPSATPTQSLGLHVLDISRKVLAPQIQMAPLPSSAAQIQMAPLPSSAAQLARPPSPSAQPSPSVQIQMAPLPSPSAQIQMRRANEPDIGVKSAINLDDVGVKFRKNEILSFQISNSTLSLPPLTFDTNTESRFLNAIAFECLHPSTNNEVSSYIAFLQGLIASPIDVTFLRSKELIQSKIVDDQAVDRLMKSISKNALFDPSSNLCVLRNDLNEYYKHNMGNCRRRLREWWRALRQSHLKNPWTIIAIIYAIVILILTALQTVYTMKDDKGKSV